MAYGNCAQLSGMSAARRREAKMIYLETTKHANFEAHMLDVVIGSPP